MDQGSLFFFFSPAVGRFSFFSFFPPWTTRQHEKKETRCLLFPPPPLPPSAEGLFSPPFFFTGERRGRRSDRVHFFFLCLPCGGVFFFFFPPPLSGAGGRHGKAPYAFPFCWPVAPPFLSGWCFFFVSPPFLPFFSPPDAFPFLVFIENEKTTSHALFFFFSKLRDSVAPPFLLFSLPDCRTRKAIFFPFLFPLTPFPPFFFFLRLGGRRSKAVDLPFFFFLYPAASTFFFSFFPRSELEQIFDDTSHLFFFPPPLEA